MAGLRKRGRDSAHRPAGKEKEERTERPAIKSRIQGRPHEKDGEHCPEDLEKKMKGRRRRKRIRFRFLTRTSRKKRKRKAYAIFSLDRRKKRKKRKKKGGGNEEDERAPSSDESIRSARRK